MRAHEKNRMHSGHIGKSGEHLVIGELLARGITVHVPIVDSGVDLIAGERVRIQVKTRRRESSRLFGYNFTMGAKRDTGSALASKLRAKSMAELLPHADVLVCVGLDERKFWIIPASVLRRYPTRQSLLLGTSHHKHFDVEVMHERLRSGMTHLATAESLGISEHTVWMHVNGRINRRKAEDVLAIAADQYENAWHEIESAVKLANEIDSIGRAEDDIESLLSASEIDHMTRFFAGEEVNSGDGISDENLGCTPVARGRC